MSFLNELKVKKHCLKFTKTNIKYADGSQEQIILSKGDQTFSGARKFQPNVYGFENLLYIGSQDAVCQENLDEYGLTDILSVGIETSNYAIN